jgi:hypothetical protein
MTDAINEVDVAVSLMREAMKLLDADESGQAAKHLARAIEAAPTRPSKTINSRTNAKTGQGERACTVQDGDATKPAPAARIKSCAKGIGG